MVNSLAITKNIYFFKQLKMKIKKKKGIDTINLTDMSQLNTIAKLTIKYDLENKYIIKSTNNYGT